MQTKGDNITNREEQWCYISKSSNSMEKLYTWQQLKWTKLHMTKMRKKFPKNMRYMWFESSTGNLEEYSLYSQALCKKWEIHTLEKSEEEVRHVKERNLQGDWDTGKADFLACKL